MQGVKISSLSFIIPSFSGNSRWLYISFSGVEVVTVLGAETSGETVKSAIVDGRLLSGVNFC